MLTNVATIIVTYNRKELLLMCLDALLNQSYSVKKIYIVDNNSTDGTLDYLRKYGITENKKIELIKLNENVGGAGGFYSGLKKAQEDGYDWYWLMDDDCLPDVKCLENLLNSGTCEYLSPLVLSREDGRTSIWWPNMEINTGLFEINSIPFNGALIKNSIVEMQGLPMKEFFIFGDDIEYSFRAKKNNYSLYINTNAIMYHPNNRSDLVPTFFNKIKIPVYNTKIKHYCYIRNNIYLSRKYRRVIDFKFNKQIIKEIYYSVFINRKDLRLVFWAIIHGFTGNFSKNKQFIEQ